LDDVEIIVVSDGSTDRTVEIARSSDETKVIVFEQNRGYGAAIKEGFRQGSGSLVGFIDADGTCDPEYFAEMYRVVVEEEADLVLSARLGPSSKMPRVRKLGNRMFALMLGFLCGRRVTDTASGMRVIRREALAELYPLPDRLHFAPAMSARALLNGLRVVEIPMHYEERIGISKLSVLGDGVRFLKTIFDGVLCYRPERLFLMAFVVCFAIATLLGLMPAEYYLSNRSL
jgi:glycosyltransferase involved in cell wall biosynthesis